MLNLLILTSVNFVITIIDRCPFYDTIGIDYFVSIIFQCVNRRNLQTQLQERELNMLYDSLATPGYLILGEVETPPSSLREKLECLDSKAKIYKKNDGTN